MSVERSFSMLKPGVLQRRVLGEILSRIERKGFRIVGLKLMRISRELAREHYKEHKDKAFFGELVEYISSAPCIAMVLEGESAVAMLRGLCGLTKADQACPGTIRGDYAMHTALNIIHASDCIESAQREIGLFFSPGELFEWEDCNNGWI